MTTEGLQGEYADQGVVMMQLNKQLKDSEKPRWQLDIDPFSRYEPLAKFVEHKYKGAKAMENQHPVVGRSLALVMRRGSDGVSGLCAKTLASVGGKGLPTANAARSVDQDANKLQEVSAAAHSASAKPLPIPQDEVLKAATSKSDSLHSMLAKQIDLHVNKSGAHSVSTPFVDERWKELPPQELASGFAEIVERQWDVMTEKHLSPAQKAELQHIRNMKVSLQQQIASLQSSHKAFERAEMDLLMTSNP